MTGPLFAVRRILRIVYYADFLHVCTFCWNMNIPLRWSWDEFFVSNLRFITVITNDVLLSLQKNAFPHTIINQVYVNHEAQVIQMILSEEFVNHFPSRRISLEEDFLNFQFYQELIMRAVWNALLYQFIKNAYTIINYFKLNWLINDDAYFGLRVWQLELCCT